MLKKTACILAGLFFSVSLSLATAGESFAGEKPNLNTATQSELAASHGIGEEMSAKIVELRSDMGDFTSWDDIRDIEGMTDAILKNITEQFQILGVESTDCNC